MNKNIVIFIYLIVFILLLWIAFIYKNYGYHPNVIKTLNSLDIGSVDKLMIVAHPDDEMFWGGAHLIEDDYLVVCVTCGRNRERVSEFTKSMFKTKDEFLMLGYKDMFLGKKDDWTDEKEKITRDIKKIINYKDWKIIVTHNPDGEYGHIHHKMLSKIVTENSSKDNLYYFGTYYTKKNINKNEGIVLSDELYKNKLGIIEDCYHSQKRAQGMFNHIFKYENWIKYSDWFKE